MDQSDPRGKKFDGVQAVVDMLNAMDEAGREKMLASLAKQDPKLVGELERRLFLFEDLIRLEPAKVQKLLRALPAPKLALALRKSSEELKSFLFSQMSARSAEMLKEEIQNLGPRRVSDIERVQKEIILLVKGL